MHCPYPTCHHRLHGRWANSQQEAVGNSLRTQKEPIDQQFSKIIVTANESGVHPVAGRAPTSATVQASCR